MVDASGFAETWLCFAVSAFELLVLFYGWRINKVTWEPLWILAMECLSYGSAAAVPDAPFRTLVLASGRELPWMRFMGWLLSCPVLLMGLISLGTLAGKGSSVRMVPILVANMVMILLGITSAGIDEPGPQRIVFALAGVFGACPIPPPRHTPLCPAPHRRRLTLDCSSLPTVGAGGVVFMTAGQVFYNMHTFILSIHFTNEDDMAAVERARRLSILLGACFFTGWLLFPIGFSLGPNFGQSISARGEMVFFFFGDLLSKNMYVGLMVFFRHYFVPLADGVSGADVELAAAGTQDSRRGMRRLPSQMITQEIDTARP